MNEQYDSLHDFVQDFVQDFIRPGIGYSIIISGGIVGYQAAELIAHRILEIVQNNTSQKGE